MRMELPNFLCVGGAVVCVYLSTLDGFLAAATFFALSAFMNPKLE